MKVRRWVQRLERSATHQLSQRTEDGLAEFIAYENGGPVPLTPYGADLLSCKRWQEWTLNQIAALYGTDEWPGWAQLRADCHDDPKWVRMIYDRVCQFFPGLRAMGALP